MADGCGSFGAPPVVFARDVTLVAVLVSTVLLLPLLVRSVKGPMTPARNNKSYFICNAVMFLMNGSGSRVGLKNFAD